MVIGSLCFPGRRIVSDSNLLTILVFIGNGGILLTLVVCKASRNSKTFELRKIKCILDKSRHEAISFRCFWWIHQQACVEAITADTSFKPRVRGKSAVRCWKIYCKIVLHLQTLKCYPKCWKILFDKIVQALNLVQLFATPWTTACQASLPITNSWSLLRLMSIESVMPFNHLIFCCPFLLLASIFPSIRSFCSDLVLRIRWPKYWSFSFSFSPFYEYSVLISLRIDWFDLLAVQGTLRSLPQHHSSKASIL